VQWFNIFRETHKRTTGRRGKEKRLEEAEGRVGSRVRLLLVKSGWWGQKGGAASGEWDCMRSGCKLFCQGAARTFGESGKNFRLLVRKQEKALSGIVHKRRMRQRNFRGNN